ncbi:hypothetical protein Golob_017653 [Gossypium lobatum]|uniref:CCHC-type domain-containing protein n=1 Tax=Gossypium lobatum TaxID=34289 RepID=A0A7J8M7V0_9ROSI|nr:hypothetical protein [Gossypium lobatum]
MELSLDALASNERSGSPLPTELLRATKKVKNKDFDLVDVDDQGLMLALAEVSGRVVKADYNTTDGKRGKFARIAVVVDLSKPLVSFLGIDRKKQAVVCEGLPSICYDCSRVGHIKEN